MTSAPDSAEETAPASDAVSASGRWRQRLYAWRFRLLLLVTLIVLVAGVWILAVLLRDSQQERGVTPIWPAQSGVTPLLVIRGPGTGTQPAFDRPLAAAFGKSGRIYVVDTGHARVCAFDAEGEYLFAFDGSQVKAGAKQAGRRLLFPAGLAVAKSGDLYVADLKASRIAVFDEDGNFLRDLPAEQTPTSDSSLSAPTDVGVRADLAYITETFDVAVLTLDGAFVERFGRTSDVQAGLDHPNGIAVSDSGEIYVSDSNHSQVKAFDRRGRIRWVYGSAEPGIGVMTNPSLPRGLAVDEDGSVLVADAGSHRLLRISETGEYLADYGSRGVEPGEFNFPNDVDVEGSLVLVTDKENNRVQVVELGR